MVWGARMDIMLNGLHFKLIGHQTGLEEGFEVCFSKVTDHFGWLWLKLKQNVKILSVALKKLVVSLLVLSLSAAAYAEKHRCTLWL